MRWLFLTHRYLGMAVSLLMVSWCLSGLVMMYVSYPQLPERMRTAALEPLSWRGAPAEGALGSDTAIALVRVEQLASRPVADLSASDGRRVLIDLTTGAEFSRISAGQAWAVAALFAQAHGLPPNGATLASVQADQWTISEQFDGERPLFKFSWPDRQGSALYVSSVSGQAVQFTTAPLRFWNWLGSVPHWVYFTPLRSHGYAWAQLMIYTSLVGCFLAVTGLYIGFLQFTRRPKSRLSPYAGFFWWHHVPGLLFGIFALSWVLSGLLSMNPWGLLQGRGAIEEQRRLAGAVMRWGDVQRALNALSARELSADRNQPDAIVSLRSAPLGARLYFIATRRDGSRLRLDDAGAVAPLSVADLQREAQWLGASASAPGSLQLLRTADRYYFSHHSAVASFPVYRVVAGDGDQTRYYLDPVSGEILRKVDASARGYRWLHEGLHRLDFTASLRTRPLWDAVMWTLLLGTSVLTATGFYAACSRWIGRPRSARLTSGASGGQCSSTRGLAVSKEVT